MDVFSPGWERSAKDNSQLYCELMYFFEYARVRALSAHVPQKFQNRQLEWVLTDFYTRLDTIVNFVQSNSKGQNSEYMRVNILRVTSFEPEQIIERYQTYQELWHLSPRCLPRRHKSLYRVFNKQLLNHLTAL